MPATLLKDAYSISQNGLKLVESSQIDKSKVSPNALGVLEGPCADFNIATRNDNYYSKKLWQKVLESDYIKEGLATKTLFGEIDHPETRMELFMQEAAVCCTALWIDESENCLMGRFEILPTEKGKLLKSILDYGSIVGVSSRGVGDLTPMEDGKNKVEEDNYCFVCFDIVFQPAAEKARQVYTSLTESEKIKRSNSLVESVCENIKNSPNLESLKSFENTISRLDLSENEKIKKTLTEVKNSFKENKQQQLINQNSILTKDLEEAYRRINTLKDQTNVLNMSADISYLRTQINNLKSTFEKSLNEVISNYQQSIKENFKLSEKNNKLQEQVKQIKAENKKLEKNVEDLTESNKSSLSEVEELNSVVEYAKNFVQKCKLKVTSLEESVDNLKKENQLLESTNSKLGKNVAQLKEANNRLERTSEQILQEGEITKKKLQENLSVGQNSTRLAQNLLLEYFNRQVKGLNIDLTVAKQKLVEAKSLKDVDLILAESSSSVSNSSKRSYRPSINEAQIDDAEIKDSKDNGEMSVVKEAFKLFKH